MGPQAGAMGEHDMNGELIGDGALDPAKPEALLYAPQADGSMKLLGVEYLVLADAWDANHGGPPILMGQLFNYGGAPNRYRNPSIYTSCTSGWAQDLELQMYGMFADFLVSCEKVTVAGYRKGCRRGSGEDASSLTVSGGRINELFRGESRDDGRAAAAYSGRVDPNHDDQPASRKCAGRSRSS